MAGLLVSVRSADEARLAWAGGAAVVDVKEPDRGPLGAADPAVWREVREAVPVDVPVSVALGEIGDWPDPKPLAGQFSGIAFRKLGLARSGPDWAGRWARFREALDSGTGPGWVAVAYADPDRAGSPEPEAVLDEAIRSGCVGVLVDTFDKSRPSPIDLNWADFVGRARASGLFVALAGRLDLGAIDRLSPLEPDLFAVRGAACLGGDRRRPIDPGRVADLARRLATADQPAEQSTSKARASRRSGVSNP